MPLFVYITFLKLDFLSGAIPVGDIKEFGYLALSGGKSTQGRVKSERLRIILHTESHRVCVMCVYVCRGAAGVATVDAGMLRSSNRAIEQ